MVRWFIPLLATLFFLPVLAQDYFCGADSIHHLKLGDTTFRNDVSRLEEEILHYNNQQRISSKDTIITIPIVFHIIHLGEAIGSGSNLSDSMVYEALDGVNDRYAGKIGAGPDSRIRFCLAVRDPDGNYTTGINRVDGSSLSGFSTYGMAMFKGQPGAYEHDVKDLSKWPTTQYYNVWIVHNIVNFAGYAYFPGTKVDPYDGAAVAARKIDYYNPVLTHEIGHGLNLYHVFERTYSSCPSTKNCSTMDDKVCDTPPSVDLGKGNCQPHNPCTSSYAWLNNRKNYMSYCTNFDRFTDGQIDRMRKSIHSTVRDSLLYSLACIPAHTNDAGITSFLTCDSALQVTMKNFGGNTISKVNVPMMINGNVSLTYKWTGSLKTYETDTFSIASSILRPDSAKDIKCWTTSPNGGQDTIVVNDTFSLESVFMPLEAGTYTVGSSSADFSTLSGMAEALNQRGICGPVVFNIKSGNYNEQIKLNRIRGVSATNTITIQSEKGHRDSVVISYSIKDPSNNYIFFFNGTDYVTTRNITFNPKGSYYYCTAIRFTNVASNNMFANCVFNAQTGIIGGQYHGALVYAGNSPDSSIVFRHSVFRNGSYGVYASGVNNLGQGVILDSNLFLNQLYMSVFLQYQNSPKIRGNEIRAQVGTPFNGIYMNICSDDIEVTDNIIQGTFIRGMEMYYCESSREKKGIIANNYIQPRTSIAAGGLYNEGIYLNYCDRLRFLHNTIDLTTSDTLSKVFRGNYSHNIEVQNNIFANQGGGYTIYITNTDLTGNVIDYNDHYTTGKYLGFNGSDLQTLIDWRISSKKDIRSVSIDPNFYADSSYIICEGKLFSAGTSIPDVTRDIEGKKRESKSPTMGVLESKLVALSLGPDLTVCDSIILKTGVPSAQYQWNTGDTSENIKVANSGLYVAQVTTSCVVQTDSINIKVEQMLHLNLGKDTSLCVKDTLTVTAPIDSFLWNTGATNNRTAVQQTGNYWVEATNACGTFSDSIFVNVDSIPTVQLGADTAACDSVVLQAPKDSDYQWNNGSSGEQLTARNTGIYWAKLSNHCGANFDSVYVEIYPSPYVGLGNDTVACLYYNLETNNTDYAFAWNTGDTTSGILIETTGDYYALLTSAQGCEASTDTISVEILPEPQPNLGQDVIIKKDEVLYISTDERYAQYLWSDGSSGDTLIVYGKQLDSSEQFYVQVTDSNGCQGNDTIYVSVKDLVEVIQLFPEAAYLMYPNPTTSVLNIRVPQGVSELTVTFYDQYGQEVLIQQIDELHGLLHTDHLQAGAYLVVLKQAGRTQYIQRVILY